MTCIAARRYGKPCTVTECAVRQSVVPLPPLKPHPLCACGFLASLKFLLGPAPLLNPLLGHGVHRPFPLYSVDGAKNVYCVSLVVVMSTAHVSMIDCTCLNMCRFLDTAQAFSREAGPSLAKFEVCDNIDLPTILQVSGFGMTGCQATSKISHAGI